MRSVSILQIMMKGTEAATGVGAKLKAGVGVGIGVGSKI